jgi:AcrR family transcriptional regulator
LAEECGIALSVIYHYFPGKEALLKEMFKLTSKDLSEKQLDLQNLKSVKSVLRQRVDFIFDNYQDYVFLLKYYDTNRTTFRKKPEGYWPEVLYQNILEVLEFGVDAKEASSRNRVADAKLISQMIYGYLLEYYPQIPSGTSREQVILKLVNFSCKMMAAKEN